jgi:hypothetical protein
MEAIGPRAAAKRPGEPLRYLESVAGATIVTPSLFCTVRMVSRNWPFHSDHPAGN